MAVTLDRLVIYNVINVSVREETDKRRQFLKAGRAGSFNS